MHGSECGFAMPAEFGQIFADQRRGFLQEYISFGRFANEKVPGYGHTTPPGPCRPRFGHDPTQIRPHPRPGYGSVKGIAVVEGMDFRGGTGELSPIKISYKILHEGSSMGSGRGKGEHPLTDAGLAFHG